MATLIYAYFTARLTRVTDLARRQQIQPIIRGSLSFIGPIYAVLRFQNIGRGSAIGVDAQIEVYPQGITPNWKWKEPVLLPEGFRDFFLPANSLDELEAKVEYILIKGECGTAFGGKESISDRLDVREFLSHVKANKMRLVETLDDHAKDIAKNTAGIDGKLDRISHSLGEIDTSLKKSVEESK